MISCCIPRSGFVSNENIPLILEINNQSSVRVGKIKAIISRVSRATLFHMETFMCYCNKYFHKYNTFYRKSNGEPISKNVIVIKN